MHKAACLMAYAFSAMNISTQIQDNTTPEFKSLKKPLWSPKVLDECCCFAP